jgi:hypothetical protein
MTYVEVTYQLQTPLREEQLRALAGMSNLFGMRSFRVDREQNRLTVNFDASRLKEMQVAQALRKANIAVSGRV